MQVHPRLIHHIIIATLFKTNWTERWPQGMRTIWICWLIVLNPKVLAIGSIVGTALHHQDDLLSVDVA